jgi:hypothetical protein
MAQRDCPFGSAPTASGEAMVASHSAGRPPVAVQQTAVVVAQHVDELSVVAVAMVAAVVDVSTVPGDVDQLLAVVEVEVVVVAPRAARSAVAQTMVVLAAQIAGTVMVAAAAFDTAVVVARVPFGVVP